MGWFRNTPDEDRTPGLAERLAQIGPGVPGHCPRCDGLGYIDNIDIGHRYQIQHCKDCGHRWEYLFDDDGVVVGLTEIDERGQPVTRTRIRAESGAGAPAAEGTGNDEDDDDRLDDEAGAADDSVIDLGGDTDDADDVLDLRDPVAEPAPTHERVHHEHLSPAEWLRHSLRR